MHTQRLLTAARHIGLTLVVGALALAGLAQLLVTSQQARAEELGQLVQQQPSGPSSAPAQVPAAPTAAPRPVTPSGQSQITQSLWAWQRTEMSNDTIITAADPSKYTLMFTSDNRLIIQADCNRAVGTYTLSGPQLTVQVGPTTLVACPPGSQGTEFLRTLNEVATFVLKDDVLNLNLKLDSGNMVFAARPSASLTGSEWQVLAYNNGMGGVTSVVGDTHLTATFSADGRVSGNSGCNLYNGPFSVSGSNMTFGALASTRRACLSDEANRQETAFLAALGNVRTYRLVGDRLTLLDGAENRQVELVRPSVQPPAPAASP